MTRDQRSNRTKTNYPPGRVERACAAMTVDALERGPGSPILHIMIAEAEAAEIRAFHPTPLSRAWSPAMPRSLIGKRFAGIQYP